MRRLLELGQLELARIANVKVSQLIVIETCAESVVSGEYDIQAVVDTLQREGIVFVDPTGSGIGVWFQEQFW